MVPGLSHPFTGMGLGLGVMGWLFGAIFFPLARLPRPFVGLLGGFWACGFLFAFGWPCWSCLFLGRLSLDCCVAVVRLVVVLGRLCGRIMRGCVASFCMAGMAVGFGAGEVAGGGLCGAAGLAWLGVRLRGGAWVDSGLVGSCLVLGRLSLVWCLGVGTSRDHFGC